MHQPFLANVSAQLNYMSTDELREIFSDEDKLETRIDEIVSWTFLCCQAINLKSVNYSQLKTLENEKDVIINENRSLAESNLEMEPRLIEIRSRINDLTQEGKELSNSVQGKLHQISESSWALTLGRHLLFQSFFRIKIIEYESRINVGYFESIVSWVGRKKR